MSAEPKVSVIIPTWRDWARVQLCLDALAAQTYPADRFEVIVVNNDPDEPCPMTQTEANVRVLDESRCGSYAARNAGIRIARGEFLLFTDSDCIPDARWVEHAVQSLEQGAARIGGAIDIPLPPGRPGWAALFEHAFGLDQAASVARGAGITANMGTRRTVMDAVGLFDDTLYSGGDVEWGRRAQRLGFDIRYCPEAKVVHPSRTTLSALFAKYRRLAGGTVRISRPQGFLRTVGWLLRALLPPIRRLRALRDHPTLTRSQQLKAVTVLYLLRVYRSWHMTLLILGLSQPVRS